MRKEEQTQEVLCKLYNMTIAFVRKHQPHYYVQYRGDVMDLAHEFYKEFLTPKSRVLGQEETLLDKYDVSLKPAELSEEVFFANLVKVSVIRKLIDKSKSDRVKVMSVESWVDEFGDVMLKTFGLSTEDEESAIDRYEFTPDIIENLKVKISNLTQKAKKELSQQYYEVRNALAPQFITVFDSVIPKYEAVEIETLYLSILDGTQEKECVCQQITPKTVCLLYQGEVWNFDRVTGACRTKGSQLRLTLDTVEKVKEFDIYKSKWSRAEITSVFI